MTAPVTHKELADKLNMTLAELYAWIEDTPERHRRRAKERKGIMAGILKKEHKRD